MADVLYVGLQDDDKIVTFGIDAGATKLVPRAETPVARLIRRIRSRSSLPIAGRPRRRRLFHAQ